MERLRGCFGDLVDPRPGSNAQPHDLLEILLIALAATLSGAEGCVDMALFGRAKEPLLRRFCAWRAAFRATTPSRGSSGCSQVVRTHWHIENCLHGVLDMVMDEDRSRARKDHAPDNLARLRRFALNLLHAIPDRGSTRGKIKRAVAPRSRCSRSGPRR
jgi:hypothetical protein